MNVLIVTASISRRGGGISNSVCGYSKELSRLCSVIVFSLQDEFSDADKVSWLPMRPVTFERSGPKQFGYSHSLAKSVAQAPADIIHSHGVWMYPSIKASIIAKTRRIPVIISPHGMLDSWGLRNSRWKKRVLSLLCTNANLRAAACIHALCESEYQSIRAYGLKNPVCIIPNGVDLPEVDRELPVPWQGKIPKDKKVMLFLGRIHPKKGLLNLVKSWSKVKPKEWILAIAGWDQGGHENQLKELVADFGLTEDVIFLGPVFNDLKQACFQNASAFILPSFSEGLPMAVLEAWSYGLPVIMTRECNIPEGFQAKAAVFVEPNVDSVEDGLRSFLTMSESQQKQLGINGRELVEDRFSWPKVAGQMIEVYEWILEKGDKPNCVQMN